MKQVIFLLCSVSLLLSSCKEKETDTNLIGSWTLIEVLQDPGDGSGEFTAINSDQTVTFSSDNLVKSNGPLCQIGSNSTTPSLGTFSIPDGTISTSGCIDIYFEIKDSYLILSYQCFEPCQYKFEKH